MRFFALLLLCLTTSFSHASGILERLSGGGKPNFLSSDQAFMLDVMVRDAHTLQANFTVTEGYYLYRDKISFSSESVKIKTSNLPQGELKHDPNFGDIQVFHQPFQAQVQLNDANTRQITLKATYQGCSDQGLCYPPIEKVLTLTLPEMVSPVARIEPAVSAITPPAVAITSAVAPPVVVSTSAIAPASNPTSDSQIADLFATGNFWLIISFFFGAGLLLAFTPCIFPMIPILSGIIVGQGHKITQKHAFILSLAYVLGMAITYAIAGVVAGLSGDLISNAMQTPAVLGSFAVIFVVLSLAMFGFYDLQLPTALQSRLSSTSNQLHGGHISSVFVMGALSAIIMGPCVAAPLAAALLYIGKTHDALLGGTALFVLALGMGAPLLLIGTSAGALLPKAGAWMEAVKRFFGVLMLGLAIWIVQPLLPTSVQMLLWSTLLIVSSTYLHVLDVQPHHTTGWHKLQKGLGLFILLLGIAYLIGALSGAKDILRPLSGIAVAQAATPTPTFKRIKNLAELNQQLAQAQGKITLLDFYADWCVSCKEMERDTFSDPAVQARWANAVRLQIDMTNNTADDKALLKHFSLYGPPAILFFDKQGKESGNFRVVGYQDAALFMKTLQQIGW
jgi:thiol:disulfide interchange protein DsbD